MTVLFLSRLFYPHVGGVEKHVLEISKRLIKKGDKVIVVTEKYSDNLTNYEIFKGIKIYRISLVNNEWLKKFVIWFWFFRHLNIINSSNIIHCHDVTFWFFPFKFIFPNKPLYTTFHGYESFPISKKAIIVRKISELISWGNICIGDFMKKWYYAKPTFISYGGVALNKRNIRLIKKKSAVFIGRLDDQTGILTYVEASEMVKKIFPSFKLTILGDGFLRNKIEQKIKVLGFKKNSEKFLHDNRFAFTSRYLSILEAMAAKRLVFAVYDNLVKKDYLEMAPFAKYIIIVKSTKDLYKQVTHFINHPGDEKEKTEYAYRWVKYQTWNIVASLYQKLWKSEK